MRISDWSSDVCSSDLDKIFTYVTVRRGYRAGGINTPGFSAVLAPFQYFGPQKVNDVEIGAKTQWSVGNVRGRFNIAAFRGVFSSLQRQIAGIPPNIDGDNDPSTDPANKSLVKSGRETCRERVCQYV